MNVLNQPVLSLNNCWQPISEKTVKDAIISLMGGDGGHNPPALALDQEFTVFEDGTIDWNEMVYANPVKWAEWIKLPIREAQGDMSISSAHMTIRVPRVIIQPNFSKMPMVRPRPTKDAIMKRDKGVCQYTGKVLTWGQGNIDHVIPRHQGGQNTFENMVWCDKKLNSDKANRTPEQFGVKLLRRPREPLATPLSVTIPLRHPSWAPMLHHHKR